MNYRPIVDTWILARSKVKYYGAYPAGFLHRARALLGVSLSDPVLHVCGGRVRDYPYHGFGPNDRTLDLDPGLSPDFVMDAREDYPPQQSLTGYAPWAAVLADPPYTTSDADQYVPSAQRMPSANLVLRRSLAVIAVGSKVGILHYQWPQPPTVVVESTGRLPIAKEVAVVTVLTGRNNRARLFTVWERLL